MSSRSPVAAQAPVGLISRAGRRVDVEEVVCERRQAVQPLEEFHRRRVLAPELAAIGPFFAYNPLTG